MKLSGRDWADIPAEPGVYRFYDRAGAVIYVGKAKRLRRRLGQYRNAKRRKKHAKMRTILRDAVRLDFEICATPLDAELLEARLIRDLRPRWNVAGAFSFMYPLLGVSRTTGITWFCYTTDPDAVSTKHPDYRWSGAYRSRQITREAFDALNLLLSWIATPVPKHRRPRARFSVFFGFRGLPEFLTEDLQSFFCGRSTSAIEELVLSLTDCPGARRKPRQVQRALDALKRFSRLETRPLRQALARSGMSCWPLPQKDRDTVFILSRSRARTAPQRARPCETAPPGH